MLGTKLRALYQRSKGRDLFDLWYALTQLVTDTDRLLFAFKEYTRIAGTEITKVDFLENLELKAQDKKFRNDIEGLIRPGLKYDFERAYDLVVSELVSKI